MQGPVAFLVFVRNPGTIKVNIHYEPNLNEMEFPYLSNYTDKIGTEENGTLRYPGPAGWPRFNPSEWGTFVVNPLNRNSTSRIALKFTSLDLGQAGSCWSANVMTYDLRDGLVFQYMWVNNCVIVTNQDYQLLFSDHFYTQGVWRTNKYGDFGRSNNRRTSPYWRAVVFVRKHCNVQLVAEESTRLIILCFRIFTLSTKY